MRANRQKPNQPIKSSDIRMIAEQTDRNRRANIQGDNNHDELRFQSSTVVVPKENPFFIAEITSSSSPYSFIEKWFEDGVLVNKVSAEEYEDALQTIDGSTLTAGDIVIAARMPGQFDKFISLASAGGSTVPYTARGIDGQIKATINTIDYTSSDLVEFTKGFNINSSESSTSNVHQVLDGPKSFTARIQLSDTTTYTAPFWDKVAGGVVYNQILDIDPAYPSDYPIAGYDTSGRYFYNASATYHEYKGRLYNDPANDAITYPIGRFHGIFNNADEDNEPFYISEGRSLVWSLELHSAAVLFGEIPVSSVYVAPSIQLRSGVNNNPSSPAASPDARTKLASSIFNPLSPTTPKKGVDSFGTQLWINGANAQYCVNELIGETVIWGGGFAGVKSVEYYGGSAVHNGALYKGGLFIEPISPISPIGPPTTPPTPISPPPTSPPLIPTVPPGPIGRTDPRATIPAAGNRIVQSESPADVIRTLGDGRVNSTLRGDGTVGNLILYDTSFMDYYEVTLIAGTLTLVPYTPALSPPV